MPVYFDPEDRRGEERRVRWLLEIGARSIVDAGVEAKGFLFSGTTSWIRYGDLVKTRPQLRDRPEDHPTFIDPVSRVRILQAAASRLPIPKFWLFTNDEELPGDLRFPLHLSAGVAETTVSDPGRLADALSNVVGASGVLPLVAVLVVARDESGLAPEREELRIWAVDGSAVAWSFPRVAGLPPRADVTPSAADRELLRRHGSEAARLFRSRCVVIDFGRLQAGGWTLLRVGAGSSAVPTHEGVFKSVARLLAGVSVSPFSDPTGGSFPR